MGEEDDVRKRDIFFMFFEHMWDLQISLFLFVLMRGKKDFSQLNYIAAKYYWPM